MSRKETYVALSRTDKLENLFIVGHFQDPWEFEEKKRKTSKGIIREDEVRDELHNMGDDVDIDWDDYDLLCSTLPEKLNVFITTQIKEPKNWDKKVFGPWCPRKIALIEIPSAHKRQSHKAVLSFGSDESQLPEGFQNRFGDKLVLTWC